VTGTDADLAAERVDPVGHRLQVGAPFHGRA